MVKFDKDEHREVFAYLDKSTVFQDAKAFNESPLNPRKCRIILAKIALLLIKNTKVSPQVLTRISYTRKRPIYSSQSRSFSSVQMYFTLTKIALRQMVYLAIKELAKIANDVMMVCLSLLLHLL